MPFYTATSCFTLIHKAALINIFTWIIDQITIQHEMWKVLLVVMNVKKKSLNLKYPSVEHVLVWQHVSFGSATILHHIWARKDTHARGDIWYVVSCRLLLSKRRHLPNLQSILSSLHVWHVSSQIYSQSASNKQLRMSSRRYETKRRQKTRNCMFCFFMSRVSGFFSLFFLSMFLNVQG